MRQLAVCLENIKVLTKHSCVYCNGEYKSKGGLTRHMSKCKKQPVIKPNIPTTLTDEILQSTSTDIHIDINYPHKANLPKIDIFPTNVSHINSTFRGHLSYANFIEEVTAIYNETVHFRKNIFNIPTGKAGKAYVTELTYWLNQFNTSDSKLNSISLKTFMVLPSLILQKPSSRSKTKEHSECILRRLEMWRNGDLNMLMREVNTIQRKLVTSQKKRSFEDTSRIFAKLVMEGKLSAALKFLDKESSSGVLILSDVVKNELLKKHPDSAPITENALLFGPIDFIPSYIFNSIDEQSIL